MAEVKLVFDTAVSMMTQFFEFLMNDVSYFGTFIIFMFLLRKLAQAFNKMKG